MIKDIIDQTDARKIYITSLKEDSINKRFEELEFSYLFLIENKNKEDYFIIEKFKGYDHELRCGENVTDSKQKLASKMLKLIRETDISFEELVLLTKKDEPKKR